MIWYQISLRILLSGGVVVAASELAKRSSIMGALLISLPLASMMTLIWLHHDGQDAEQLALFSKEVLWLVIPSLTFFLTLPLLLKNRHGFHPFIRAFFCPNCCLLRCKSVCPLRWFGDRLMPRNRW
jgi:F0F1-type ATP synthase assembly protein I